LIKWLIEEDNIIKLKDNPDISEEDKDSLDKYISDMSLYINNVESTRVHISTNMRTLTHMFNDIKPKVVRFIIHVSTY